MTQVRVRFAPSPTGYLHVGGARTALFNWLYAKKNNGVFILRIEDTDVERSTQESVDAILQGMEWLGLNCDEGPYYQSDNFDKYKRYIEKLLDEGKAYKCYCKQEDIVKKREDALKAGKKPKYDGTCRDKHENLDQPFVIRFKAPQDGAVVFDDIIKGKISFPAEELDDLIIQRTDGTPTYNFCVVIDDALMQITTVIRGDDHVNNTPRQIQLYEALGFPVPQFAHVPMILGSDKTRLSKRHGATSVMAYRDMGYLPEALINYLVRLGWSHLDDEIFSREEMIEKFDISHIGRSPSVFNPEKLNWLNAHYIKNSDNQKIAELLKFHLAFRDITSFGDISVEAVASILKERAQTLEEMANKALFFFKAPESYDEAVFEKFGAEHIKSVCRIVIEKLNTGGTATVEEYDHLLKAVCTDNGWKMPQVGQPLRVALSGGTQAPGIGDIIAILGKDESVKRLQKILSL